MSDKWEKEVDRRFEREVEQIRLTNIMTREMRDGIKPRKNEDVMENKLKCGCIRGYFLCPEAVKLWKLYIMEDDNKNYKKAKYYRKQYENHFVK